MTTTIGVPLLTEAEEQLFTELDQAILADVEVVPPPPIAPRALWTVDLCIGWQRVGTVDSFEFSGERRHLEPGSWSLTSDQGAVRWSERTVDGRVVSYAAKDVDTVRLVRPDGRIGFAGFVAPTGDGVGGMELLDDGDESKVSWSGPDLWDVLVRRIVFPDPTTDPPWSVSYDVRTGIASAQVAAFILSNAGTFALPARQIPGLVVDDRTVGTSGTWSGRLEPLSELVAKICRTRLIACRPSVAYDGTITILLTEQADKSEVLVMSDRQDLVRRTARRVPAQTTWSLAGGTGEGSSRLFSAQSNLSTGAKRREEFIDMSSITTAAELAQEARVNQVEDAPSWSVSAELEDSASVLAYFPDLADVGDWITVEIDGERVKVQITAAQYEVTAERQVVRPILGEAIPNALRALQRKAAAAADASKRIT